MGRNEARHGTFRLETQCNFPNKRLKDNPNLLPLVIIFLFVLPPLLQPHK